MLGTIEEFRQITYTHTLQTEAKRKKKHFQELSFLGEIDGRSNIIHFHSKAKEKAICRDGASYFGICDSEANQKQYKQQLYRKFFSTCTKKVINTSVVQLSLAFNLTTQ